VIVGIAVQEQQGRAGPTMAHADDGTLDADVEMLESGEQGRDFRAAPTGRIANIINSRFVCASVPPGRRGDARRRRAATNA
jgi:hypothetical protein